MTNKEVVLAKTDDWTVLYVEGVKILENHTLGEAEIFEALGLNVKEVWLDDCWVEDHGHDFPLNADELFSAKYEVEEQYG